MKAEPSYGKIFCKHVLNIIYKVFISIVCIVMLSYPTIGLVKYSQNETQYAIITEETENEFKPTSRGKVRNMPKSQTYIIYKLKIKDKTLCFDNVDSAELYKKKIEEGTNEEVTGEIEMIFPKITEDFVSLTGEKEAEEFIEQIIKEYNINKTFYPTISHRVSSNYGGRKSPTAGASSFHKGIDISGNYGDDVYAYKYGTVISSGYNSGGYGNMILIQHYDGSCTRYAHLSEILVKQNEIVFGGQLIGRVGSTGISTGNHLHFEMIIDNANVNPYNYIF